MSPVASAARPDNAAIPAARWSLAALSLSMLLSSLGTSIANVGLPAMADAFGASFSAVQWIVLAYLLAVTTLIVTVGRLGDTIGRKRLLLAGLALFTAASVACGLAPSLPFLVAARAAQGAGAAAMMALSMAFVGGIVAKEKTGSAMGMLGAMSAVGTALGPTLGGALISVFGWRTIFLAGVPLGLVAFVMALRNLPADDLTSSRKKGGFDLPGMLVLAVTLGAYALAMTVGRGAAGQTQALLLGAAFVGVVLFAFAEYSVASPLVPLGMFRDPLLDAGLAASALVSTVMMATLVVGPFYLSRALGLDAAIVGLVMSAGPVAAALTGVPAGRLTDRFGAQAMTAVGLIGIIVGCGLLALLPASFGIASYVAPLLLTTASYALFQAANNTGVMKEVAADRRGVVSGMLNLSRNLGLVSGASAMGAVFAAGASAADVTTAGPEAVAAGMRFTFAVSAGLVAVGLVIAVVAGAFSARRPA